MSANNLRVLGELPKTHLKIIPWVECNGPDHVEATVDGLRGWLSSTDTAIVTTTHNFARLYSDICQRVPRMRIYPGLKTDGFLEDDFASPEGWKAIQREVVDAIWRTRTHVFVFEMESAMRPVWEGKQECDLNRLRASIQGAHFPTNVTYWWYPSIGAWSEDEQGIAASVCRTVQASLRNVVFLDSATFSGPKSLTWDANVRAMGYLPFAYNPPIPMLYCYGPTKGWWQDEDLPEALEYVEDGPAILYPGLERWPEAAREISRILIDAGLIPRVRG
jgi:hypothetical protein